MENGGAMFSLAHLLKWSIITTVTTRYKHPIPNGVENRWATRAINMPLLPEWRIAVQRGL